MTVGLLLLPHSPFLRFPLLPKEEVEISGKGLSDYDDNGALCG